VSGNQKFYFIGATIMKNLTVKFFISLFYSSLVFAQSPDCDPLADSYMIQVGGGNQLLALNYSEVTIYKYVDNHAIFDQDTLVNTLSYSTSGSMQ
jgi:hypothetical protein